VTLQQRLSRALPAIVVGVGFLALWELFVRARDIQPFLLPAPSLIWEQFTDRLGDIGKTTRATGTNALVGLVLGTVLGIVMALVSSRVRFLRDMVIPLAAAVNAMPIVALAPMFNNIFSSTSAIPRRLVVTIIVFFPIFINVLRGLTQVDPLHDELLRSYAASERERITKLRIPAAIPFLCTGLKVAAPLCVIAAVVSEYFGGLQNGLGSRITSAASNSAYGRAWAYVLGACLLGLAFYLASVAIERLAMPWRAAQLEAGAA
jgi:NitT/TauT family transport system permease protein